MTNSLLFERVLTILLVNKCSLLSLTSKVFSIFKKLYTVKFAGTPITNLISSNQIVEKML